MIRLAAAVAVLGMAFTCASEEAADHAAAESSMVSALVEGRHLRLTALRPAAPGDSSRAAAILAAMRRDLSRYRDIRVAEGDGFRQFIAGGAAPVQHYTKLRWWLQAKRGLDPSRPSSLLYRKAADGSLELMGAMFTAPPGLTEDELNERLPLSVTRWHQHVNWCVPPVRNARARWAETRDGHPVFGPRSPIATAEACAAVGGRFRPRVLGWMVHVMSFTGDDPAVIWGAAEHGAHAH
ncbi:MAG TPA: hypothetical protein VGJ83_05050 [Gemmatimonadales bacterium]